MDDAAGRLGAAGAVSVEKIFRRERISTKELEKLLLSRAPGKQSRNENFFILDVRPDLFYAEGHIPGARNLPRAEFEQLYPAMKAALSKAELIVVYCAGGHCEEAELVAGALRRLGHGNVAVYAGGWEEWEREVKS